VLRTYPIQTRSAMKFFQSFRLDGANQCLWREQARVSIPPKAYDVLRYLVENPDRLVTQDELLDKLWPDTYVNPEVIRKYILEIRRILGDGAVTGSSLWSGRKTFPSQCSPLRT
jgi:DNA-binding winged helix-turn-helix (wHTH) protein